MLRKYPKAKIESREFFFVVANAGKALQGKYVKESLLREKNYKETLITKIFKAKFIYLGKHSKLIS